MIGQRKNTAADIVVVGFALFSMFFGAGNVIFPPFLGMEAGDLVRTVSAVCGGKGVGKPDSAMGGSERSGMGFTIMESFTDRLVVRSVPGKGAGTAFPAFSESRASVGPRPPRYR